MDEDSPLLHRSPLSASTKRLSRIEGFPTALTGSSRRPSTLPGGPLEEEEQEAMGSRWEATTKGERRKSVGLGLRFGMEGFLVEDEQEEDEEQAEQAETGQKGASFFSLFLQASRAGLFVLRRR
jgi:hypothetical protein